MAATPDTSCKVAGEVDALYHPGDVRARLTCSAIWVDVRLCEIHGRWIASSDTPEGPSLGLGEWAFDAIERAIEPFDGIADELLASFPRYGLGSSQLSPDPRRFWHARCGQDRHG